MNHVGLIGNLTRDPEVRFTGTGKAACEFTIAATKRWRTESGEERERTAFIGCVCWGKRGEAFAQHHKKGQRAAIEGELIQETWDDKETGKKREKTKVEVTAWHFVNAPQQGAESRYKRSTTGGPAKAPVESSANPPPEDDDVPF